MRCMWGHWMPKTERGRKITVVCVREFMKNRPISVALSWWNGYGPLMWILFLIQNFVEPVHTTANPYNSCCSTRMEKQKMPLILASFVISFSVDVAAALLLLLLPPFYRKHFSCSILMRYRPNHKMNSQNYLEKRRKRGDDKAGINFEYIYFNVRRISVFVRSTISSLLLLFIDNLSSLSKRLAT